MVRFAITRFRFLGLHVVSWVVALVVSVVMILITVPGDWASTGLYRWRVPRDTDPGWADEAVKAVLQATVDRHSLGPQGRDSAVLFEHGWPCTYLVRSQYAPYQATGGRLNDAVPLLTFETEFTLMSCAAGPDPISWSDYDNWPIESDAFRFHFGRFLVNLLVGVGIVVGVVTLVEWRIRRRDGVLRFRLLDLLTGVTLLALGLGWWQYHVRIEKSDQRTLAELGMEWDVSVRNSHRYVGPQWLVKLIGNTELLPRFLHHVTYVDFYERAPSAEDLTKVARMKHVTQVESYHPVTRAALTVLGENRRLRQLSLRFPSPEELPGYNIPPTQYSDLATSADLSSLHKLPLLILELTGKGVGLEDVEPFAESETLRAIYLSGTDLSDTDIESLQNKHPQIVIRGCSMLQDLFHW